MDQPKWLSSVTYKVPKIKLDREVTNAGLTYYQPHTHKDGNCLFHAMSDHLTRVGLVQELEASPDSDVLGNLQPTQDDTLTPKYNFDMISEALTELESFHPGLFKNLPLSKELTGHNFISIDNELTDDELIETMQQYEE